MSGWAGYLMGWGGVCLGAYVAVLSFNEFIQTFSNKASFVVVFGASMVFFIAGLLGISIAKNLANRARVIQFNKHAIRVEFWWRGRRKDATFTLSDVESVEFCQKEKGIIELLAKLPREPICYEVQVRGQPTFIVTGTDEEIHQIMKLFSPSEDRSIEN